jgi:hypothetical protein
MKNCLLLSLILLTISCTEKSQENEKTDDVPTNETSISNEPEVKIGNKEITNELAGSNYRKRAKGYFLINGKDTMNFMPVFMEAKDDGTISINIRFSDSLTYDSQLEALNQILPTASKDFNFDSLTSASLGRLISSGDLAIDISKKILEDPTINKNKLDYQKVSVFLTKSKLAEDLNNLFQPYKIAVEGVSIEKVFFTNKKDLLSQSKIETRESEIPEEILDCQLWVKFKKK